MGITISADFVFIKGANNFSNGNLVAGSIYWLGTDGDMVTTTNNDTTHWNRPLGQAINESIFYFNPAPHPDLLGE